MKMSRLVLVILALAGAVRLVFAGTASASVPPPPAGQSMYVIEREIPGAAQFTPEKLKAISQTSCSVLEGMGADKIRWLHSYVAGDKIYCVYFATSEEAIREHAQKGGFPANRVTKVATVISPKTAE